MSWKETWEFCGVTCAYNLKLEKLDGINLENKDMNKQCDHRGVKEEVWG